MNTKNKRRISRRAIRKRKTRSRIRAAAILIMSVICIAAATMHSDPLSINMPSYAFTAASAYTASTAQPVSAAAASCAAAAGQQTTASAAPTAGNTNTAAITQTGSTANTASITAADGTTYTAASSTTYTAAANTSGNNIDSTIDSMLTVTNERELAAVQKAKAKVQSLGREPRIIATSPATAEICDKLGLDLVGVCSSTSSKLPDRYSKTTTVGTAMSPDMEIIASLSPDWILSPQSLQSDLQPKYEALDTDWAFLNLRSVEGMYKSINELGEIFGREAQAAELISEFREFYTEYSSRIGANGTEAASKQSGQTDAAPSDSSADQAGSASSATGSSPSGSTSSATGSASSATESTSSATGSSPSGSASSATGSASSGSTSSATGSASGTNPKVLILMGLPGSYIIATENSYVGSLVKLAGGENVYTGTEEEFLTVNTEDMKTKEPDVILRAAHALPGEVKEMFDKEFSENDIWKHFEAVENGRVYDLPYDEFGMSANFTYPEALETLLSMLYPDKIAE